MGRWWVRERTHSTCALAHTTQSEPEHTSREAAARTCALAHTTQSANGQLLPRNNQVSISPISRACLLSPSYPQALERPRPRVLRLASLPSLMVPRPDLPLGFSAGDPKILRKRMNLESPQRLVDSSK